jgi:hypothetical protein
MGCERMRHSGYRDGRMVAFDYWHGSMLLPAVEELLNAGCPAIKAT